MALLGALAKFGMGMLHGDGNTRQCMATSVVAYKQAFGFDAPPYTYADFEESDVIVLVGSNLCIAHPILWQRVMRNPHRPEIIVIDPRATETAMAATQHLPLYPKSDLDAALRRRAAADRARLDRPRVHRRPHHRLRRVRGVRRRLHARARRRGNAAAGRSDRATRRNDSRRASACRSGGRWASTKATRRVRTAQAIINLALMTGNIGRPGTGANSITGQCNAMGSRLFSNTTNLLGGHDFANPDASPQGGRRARHRRSAHPARERAGPTTASWKAFSRGEIRGLWVIATNPAHSWINQDMARDVLDRLDFLVVQDMYHTTETAQLAAPGAARRRLGREGGHVHQLRAPHRR